MVSGDLLSASSLLVALITFLYSTWYQETSSALELPIKRFRLDRGPHLTLLRRVLITRALPICLAASALVLVLAPPAIKVAWHAVADGWGRPYDAVKACFLLVWILSVFLAAVSTHRALALFRHMRRQSGPDLNS
jgi:hypothetical protein